MASVKSVLTAGLCALALAGTAQAADTDRYSENLVRIARISVHPEKLDSYLAMAAEVGRASMQKEPGVRVLYSVQSKEHPTEITILEIYANDAAYRSHLQTEHFKKYKEGTAEMVKSLELIDCNALVPEALIKP